MELSKLLVIIEPDSETQPALEKAKSLARLADCEIELLLTEFTTYLEDGFFFDPEQAKQMRYDLADRRMADLEALAQPLREQGLEVSCSVAWGNPPYMETLSRIKQLNPSMVLKTTRHHSKVSRMFLTHEDWELVRYSPVPLLLVKERHWEDAPRILVAVDPYHINDKPAALENKMITAARAFANETGGDVHLFHSAWVSPLAGSYPLAPNIEKEETVLHDMAAANGVDGNNVHWSLDRVDESLPEVVDELGVNILVMGAISRSKIDRLLLGSTAEKIIDSVECDILILKPDEMPSLNTILV
jgi:universal stress protein E